MINQMDEETIITLVSDHSMDYFPDNSPSHFSNKLFKAIDFPEMCYEIAVTEIMYQEPLPPIERPPPEEQQLYFGVIPENNKALVHYGRGISLNHYKKSSQTFDQWNSGLATSVTQNNNIYTTNHATVRFMNLYEDNDVVKSIINVEFEKPDLKLVISPPIYAKILGFRTNEFSKSGEYISEDPVNPELWELLPDLDSVNISLERHFSKEILIEEPAQHEVELLINAIGAAFVLSGLKVLLDFDPETGILEVELGDQIKSVKFPIVVNNEFGLDDEFIFTDRSTMLNIVYLKQARVERNRIYFPTTNILMLTNLIDGKHYGSQCVPILRVFPREHTNTIKHLVFDPLYFSCLTSSHLQNIEIKLVGDNFKPLIKSNTPTTVVLKIRRKI